MRTLANILWHIPFLGFISAITTFLLGLLLVLTVVGAPIGLGIIQFSKFLMGPFSYQMIDNPAPLSRRNKLWMAYGFVIRVLYFPIGLVLLVANLIQIIGLVLSIVGIPLAIVIAKSLGTYFNPVDKICVSAAYADEVEAQRARRRMGVCAA